MQIIREQLWRIKHFLGILLLLFIVNAGFNLRYEWGGISVIARVYIMVLSFYIIFIFSQLNIDEYRATYINDFGWKGKYYLFFSARLFPFIFIYLLTMLFTLINYLNTENWPVEPILKLFGGRYSNTVIYSLILFMVLKLKKRPGISIPLFILCSVCYFVLDKIVYFIFSPGIGVSVIKITKYIIFMFIIICDFYDFSKSRWRLVESTLVSIATGMMMYLLVLTVFLGVFFMSSYESPAFSISGEMLLKSGFSFPLEKLQNSLAGKGSGYEIKSLLMYIEKYNKDINYTPSDWEKIITNSRIEKNEIIFRYLNKKNIKLDFALLKSYAENQLQIPLRDKAGIEHFAKHLSSYYPAVKHDLFSMYESGNDQIKILILKSLAYTDDPDAIRFLIDKLTGINSEIAGNAYNSLKKITGKDPAFEFNKDIYDLDVVLYFKNYLSGIKKNTKL